MSPEGPDPAVVDVVAVTVEDVVTAVETNASTGRRAVLRMTPPLSGRMRARLHVVQPGEPAGTMPQPVTIDPAALLEPDAPPYPDPDATADALRADPDATYAVETHRARHQRAVAAWRRATAAAIRERARLETDAGATEVSVVTLRDSP